MVHGPKPTNPPPLPRGGEACLSPLELPRVRSSRRRRRRGAEGVPLRADPPSGSPRRQDEAAVKRSRLIRAVAAGAVACAALPIVAAARAHVAATGSAAGRAGQARAAVRCSGARCARRAAGDARLPCIAHGRRTALCGPAGRAPARVGAVAARRSVTRPGVDTAVDPAVVAAACRAHLELVEARDLAAARDDQDHEGRREDERRAHASGSSCRGCPRGASFQCWVDV